MKSKTTLVIVGVVLIIIALILGAIQHFGSYNIYGTEDNKWYFYGLVGIIGLIGIIVAVWGLMKTEPTPKQGQPSEQKPTQ